MSSSAAIRAGRAFVELFTKDDELRKGLKAARTRIDNFAKGVNALSNHLLALGSAAAVPFGFAIKAASDLEETMSKFNVVFGKSSAAVQKWGDDFAASVGRSKRQVAEFLAGTQDLLVPVGIDPRRAEELSKTITQLAVDLGSFNNMADATVLRDLQAALTGSGETMKKYGVIVSEAAVKQELLNQKIDPTRATDAEKVMARLNIILRGTTAAQGDALRTADSFANKTKSLAAEIENAAGEIGKALLPVLTPLIDEVVKVVKEFADWAAENKDLVVQAAKLTAGMLALGVALKPIAYALTTISGLAKGLDLAIVATRAIGPWKALGVAIGGAALTIGELTRQSKLWQDVWKHGSTLDRAQQAILTPTAALTQWLMDKGSGPEASERDRIRQSVVGRLSENGILGQGLSREAERQLIEGMTDAIERWQPQDALRLMEVAAKQVKQIVDRAAANQRAAEDAQYTPSADEKRALDAALSAPADKLDEAAKAELDAAFRLMEAGKAIQATLDYQEQQRFDRMQVEADLEEWFAQQPTIEDLEKAQQDLLNRLPETLTQGSEAAAKAFLDANRGANPVLDVARQQVQAIHEVRELLRRANELSEKMQQRGLRVEGFALGR